MTDIRLVTLLNIFGRSVKTYHYVYDDGKKIGHFREGKASNPALQLILDKVSGNGKEKSPFSDKFKKRKKIC